MAITAYTGLPGSGKSYSVVEHVILPALRKSRKVFTNVPLAVDLVESEFPGQVTLFSTQEVKDSPDWFQDTFQPGATLVLDEAWRLWPAGLKANNLLEAHKSFLAEHRHMVGPDGTSTEICLVTQDLGQIAAYPRSLVDTTYRTVKLSAVGQEGRFRVDVYQGAATGPNPPASARIRQIHGGKYKPEVYRYYQSQTMSQAAGHGDESRTDSRVNLLNSKLIKYGVPASLIAAPVVLWLGFSTVADFYNEPESKKPEPAVVTSAQAIEAAASQPKPLPRNHFYTGTRAYIAYNMGRTPFIEYRIGFVRGNENVVLDEKQLSRMGYWVRGYNECYVQLVGKGAELDIFCERLEPDQREEADTSFPVQL